MAKIQLNTAELIVDDCDVRLFLDGGPVWQEHKGRHTSYASRKITVAPNKRVRQYAHRIITNAPPKLVVDHINGNGLDCRRNNLRVVGYSRNAQNVHYVHGEVPKRGVSKCGRKYRARIMLHGEEQYLGRYDTIEEAAAAYDEAALRLFGPFAWTNTPRDLTPTTEQTQEIPF